MLTQAIINPHDNTLALVESKLLDLPQDSASVTHRFGPGIYIREVFLPAGSLVIGHRHKVAHSNVMLKGKMAAVVSEEKIVEMQAPLFYTSGPGRKFVYVIEDVVFQNIWATGETNIDKLEDMFLEKGQTWRKERDQFFNFQKKLQQFARDDFNRIKAGVSEEKAKEFIFFRKLRQFKGVEDKKFSVRRSPIEGRGLYVTSPVNQGRLLLCVKVNLINAYKEIYYINHSPKPTLGVDRCGDFINFYAAEFLPGCIGGDEGTELTVSYAELLGVL